MGWVFYSSIHHRRLPPRLLALCETDLTSHSSWAQTFNFQPIENPCSGLSRVSKYCSTNLHVSPTPYRQPQNCTFLWFLLSSGLLSHIRNKSRDKVKKFFGYFIQHFKCLNQKKFVFTPHPSYYQKQKSSFIFLTTQNISMMWVSIILTSYPNSVLNNNTCL